MVLICQHGPPSAKSSEARQAQVIRALVVQAESEKDLLVRMIEKEPQQLPKSRIGVMLHAAKDAQFGAPDWSNEILASLPSSDLEMEAFLEFTIGRGNEKFEPFLRIYYAMAFKAAVLHPEALHKVFQIAREYETQNWPDYDNVDWFCDELKSLKRGDPGAFQAALESEKPGMKSYISGCANMRPR
jgi:hypothetical protein